MSRRNVILFGGSGVGKSSVVNMLAGYNVADTSSGATGCTFKNAGYDVDICGIPFRLHDTAGLNEGDEGRIPNSDAIVQLYTLLKRLDDGLSLLVFCMKAPRLTESAPSNWKLFHEVMCKRNVPIVMVITGLELERDMNAWWTTNKDSFRKNGMLPSGQPACITAIKGKEKRGVFFLQEEYDESRGKVQQLILDNYMESPWKMESVRWFNELIHETTYSYKCFKRQEHKRVVGEIKGAMDELVTKCGMSEEDARALATRLDRI